MLHFNIFLLHFPEVFNLFFHVSDFFLNYFTINFLNHILCLIVTLFHMLFLFLVHINIFPPIVFFRFS